jgi:hypothetical protein
LGREDAAVGRDPGKLALPGVRHGKAHTLIGLCEQPVRRSLVIAVELTHGELGVGQHAGQEHAELPISRRLAGLPCLLHLAVKAAQVDRAGDLVFPDTVIVHQRVTNGRDFGRLHRSRRQFLTAPGWRYHRRSTQHHGITQQVSTVRGSVPLVEQPKRLSRGVIQLTDYAAQRWPRAALAPFPAAELRPRKDEVWQPEPVGNPLGLPGGVVL